MTEIEMTDKRSRDTRMSIVFFVPDNRTPSLNWALLCVCVRVNIYTPTSFGTKSGH